MIFNLNIFGGFQQRNKLGGGGRDFRAYSFGVTSKFDCFVGYLLKSTTVICVL